MDVFDTIPSGPRHERASHGHHAHSSTKGDHRRDHSESTHDDNPFLISSDMYDRMTVANMQDTGWSATTTRPLYKDLHNVDRDEVLQMKKRLSMLERQNALLSNGNDNAQRSSDSILEDEAAENAEDHHDLNIGATLEQQNYIPQIRKRTLEEFTNKYASDKDEYAIELLMRKMDSLQPGKRVEVHTVVSDRTQDADQKSQKESHVMPGRIRINSPWILNALASLSSEIDPTAPTVMLRPWKFLAHHERRIRDLVRKHENDRENKLLHSDDCDVACTDMTNSGYSPILTQLTNGISEQQEILHLKCLIEFLDQYIEPMRTRFDGKENQKIRFKDLWWLFQPGDDVYMPVKIRGRTIDPHELLTKAEAFQGRYERMWRVTATTGGHWNLASDHNSGIKLSASPFRVSCYYVDFDGRYFLPITHTFSIMPFDGEKNIINLDIVPMRYVADQMHVIDQTVRRGGWVFEQMARRSTHFYYAGPTLVVHPCGCLLHDENLHQEHIESEVIVDFSTTLLRHPSWRPKSTLWKPPPRSRHQAASAVRQWLNRSEPKPFGILNDNVYDDYWIDLQRATDFKEQELIFAPIPTDWISNESRMPEKDLVLLTTRGFAFVLRTRTFAPIWLLNLEEIKPQSSSLTNLQLKDNNVKENIRALVRVHFRQEQRNQAGEVDCDIVRGKGKGLVILLHGAPGVGKTSTAESIAAANGKPLFQITCGDLGLTPKEVERALKEIFRYAQMWQCILLLDECDVFLAARSKNDIQRNSLVSVFLRVLEFYTGVLFLTTNRVGVLDDAVRSRITLPIYYPPLDEAQTGMIWKSNIAMLKERHPNMEVDTKDIMRFAKQLFHSSDEAQPKWNGRQIHAAFKVAAAFAEWEQLSEEERYGVRSRIDERDNHKKVQLTSDHFTGIAATNNAFDKYTYEVTGTTEVQRAWNAMERADEHDPEGEDEINNNLLSPGYKESHSRPFNPRGSVSAGNYRPRSISPCPVSPVDSRSAATMPTMNNSHARRKSSSIMAAHSLTENVMQQPSLKRKSGISDAADKLQSHPSEPLTNVSSIDVLHASFRRDMKRQRADEQQSPTSLAREFGHDDAVDSDECW